MAPQNLVNIGSGNGLSPSLRQAIAWAIADGFSIGNKRSSLSEVGIKIQNFFKENTFEMSFSTRGPFFLRPQHINPLCSKIPQLGNKSIYIVYVGTAWFYQAVILNNTLVNYLAET